MRWLYISGHLQCLLTFASLFVLVFIADYVARNKPPGTATAMLVLGSHGPSARMHSQGAVLFFGLRVDFLMVSF